MRSELIKEVVDPLAEARRYVDNAKQTLAQNGQLNKEEHRYEDEKYVKAAGNYLWLSVLMALDAVFHVKANKKKSRVSALFRRCYCRHFRQLVKTQAPKPPKFQQQT